MLVELVGPWLSLVERLVRDEEAASSNLAGPTILFSKLYPSGEVRTQFDCDARSAKECGRQPNGRARWGEGHRDNLAGPTIPFFQVVSLRRGSNAVRLRRAERERVLGASQMAEPGEGEGSIGISSPTRPRRFQSGIAPARFERRLQTSWSVKSGSARRFWTCLRIACS